jgi:hypothetical protein
LLRFIPALLPATTQLIAAILLMVALSHSCAAKGDAHHNPRKQPSKERASQCVLEFHRVLQKWRNARTRVRA